MQIKQPAQIEIEESEIERLIDRANHGQLDTADQQSIVPLLRTLVWLQRALFETRISLTKLRKMLFGRKTEKNSKPSPYSPGKDKDTPSVTDKLPSNQVKTTHPPDDITPDTKASPEADDTKVPNQPRGHGRLSATDYTGADQVFQSHNRYRVGDRCPYCERGQLYALPPLVRLRFRGQPLSQVTCYELERLRCSSCGAIFVAGMPKEAGHETYAVSLKVVLAIAHYHLGLPFKRIEAFQSLAEMPLPDATQWSLVEEVADTAYVIYEYLKKIAVNYPWVYQDDTPARILSLIIENRTENPKRKAMQTTVLYFEGEQSICLYMTGRHHAGENLDELLKHRDSHLPPIQRMADGLAANHLKHNDSVESQCLTHGRRKFVDIEDFFPIECWIAIDIIRQIYENDAYCRQNGFTPEQRLTYHQAHSQPLMEQFKAWIEELLQEKLVEPNSRLGGAFQYILKRWDGLTRFLVVAGAPLDNNIAERAIKMIIRYRKNSLFYANAHGAYVGDVITSLIETCRANLVNPLDYLTALLEHRSEVFQNPDLWLPWNYRENLTTVS